MCTPSITFVFSRIAVGEWRFNIVNITWIPANNHAMRRHSRMFNHGCQTLADNVAYCDYSVKPTASSRPGPAEAAATEMAGAAGASVPMPTSAAPEAPAAPAAVVESAAA